MSESQETTQSNDSNEVLIEEIDSNDVSENELAQFQETEPLRIVEIIEDCDNGDAPVTLDAAQSAEEEAIVCPWRMLLVSTTMILWICSKL